MSQLQEPTWEKVLFDLDITRERRGHTCTVIGQYVFIIGGTKGENKDENADAVVFDIEKGTFKQLELSGRKPGRLFDHSACYWKDFRILVSGGYAYRSLAHEVGIITILNLDQGLESMELQWENSPSAPHTIRACHTTHIYENKMFAFGGEGNGHVRMNDVLCLDLEKWTWKQCKQKGQKPRGALISHSSTLYGNQVYVLGKKDRNDEKENRVFATFNLNNSTWTRLPLDSDYFDYKCAQIQQYDGKIYLVKKLLKNDESSLVLKSFDISKNEWTEISTNNEDLQIKGRFSLTGDDQKLVLYGECAQNELWVLPLDGSMKLAGKKPETLDKNTQIMKAFLAEAPYSDVTFEVEGQLIPAHKWWLCNRSKYFANMFASGMTEANTSKIVVSDITVNTFRGFLEFLYSDHIELDSTLAEELLTQADKYSVPALKKLCEGFLSQQLTPENYVKLANLSELVEADLLREAAKNYIAKNIKKLKEGQDFEQISTEMLRDVIVKVILK